MDRWTGWKIVLVESQLCASRYLTKKTVNFTGINMADLYWYDCVNMLWIANE